MIAALAAEQHGVVARVQLLDAGLTSSMVERRLTNGRLLKLHRGVYAVGHARLIRDGHRLAAVPAAGPGAALSHREAAALHALLPTGGATIDVTVAAQRRVPGVKVHRSVLPRADVTKLAGIPVTTVARTLVDLAGVLPANRLRKALDEAERSHRLDINAIKQVLARTRGRKGRSHAAIRAALDDLAATGATITRSDLEDRFLALLADHGLPRPRTNQLVEGIQVDACWPEHRVVVELDGYAYHHAVHAFTNDRERSNDLVLAGYVVLRFTHGHVVRRAGWVAERIARALSYAAAPTG